MVDLGVEPDQAALHAFDDRELPQRPVAIEHPFVQPGHGGLELHLRAGPGQQQPLDVVVDVGPIVPDPHRIREVERHERELARKQRRQVHASLDVRADVVEEAAAVAFGLLEQHQAAHVHGHLRRFQVQEQGVERTQVLHAGSSVPAPDGGAERHSGTIRGAT
ncbi:MAG: hypothetical protein IPI73_23775 [Betaproteobacteria bacterium]|nr:hypothetical protein [Betaproteobacteria bacterium]